MVRLAKIGLRAIWFGAFLVETSPRARMGICLVGIGCLTCSNLGFLSQGFFL